MLRRYVTMVALSAVIVAPIWLSAPTVHADSNCSDAAACLASFDDANPGDNQGGDAGADRDRDRSDQRK